MRTHIRQPTQIPVEVTAPDIPVIRSPHLKNISFGGLCLRADRPLKAGTSVNIRLPSLDPDFETRGRISWCRQERGGIELGVEFLDPDSGTPLHMVEQVCDIERYRKQVLQQEGRHITSEEAARELHRQQVTH